MIHTVSTTITQVLCYSNYYISILSITALMSLWAILSQQLLRHWGPISQQFPCLYDPYLQLLRYNDTYCLNNYYSGPMLQPLLCLHALYIYSSYVTRSRNNYYATKALYHSNYYVSMTYIYSSYVTILHTVSTTITQALYHSNYYVYMTYIYSSYVTMIYTVATTITSLRPNITAITMSLWPIFTTLTLQWYILSQQLLFRPYSTATTMSTWSIPTALTSLWPMLLVVQLILEPT